MKDHYSSSVFYDDKLKSYTLYICNDRTKECVVAKEFFDFKDFFAAFKLSLEQKSFGSIDNDHDLVDQYNNRRSEYDLGGFEVIIASGENIHIYLPLLPVDERERWLNILARKTVKLSRNSFLLDT